MCQAQRDDSACGRTYYEVDRIEKVCPIDSFGFVENRGGKYSSETPTVER